MPARVRGGSLDKAKPRPKASSSARTASARGGARGAVPGKLHGAYGRLPAKWAVGITAGVMAIGVGMILFTGGRLHAASYAMAQGVAGELAGAGFRLHALHVEGASAMAQADIVRATGLYRDA